MSRKKRHEEHANHERWLVSYADFITLLFAFFVVLYSSSQVDKRKVGKLSLAIQVAFQQMGVFETSNTKMPLSTTEAMPFQDAQVIENVVRTDDLRRIVQPGQGVMSNAVASGEMLGIQAEIEKALSPEIRAHVVVLKEQREGLVISLREIGFFDSGSATLRESSEDAIGRLASILSQRSEMLRIEGHTDNMPIHTSQFQSNWSFPPNAPRNSSKCLSRATILLPIVSRRLATPSFTRSTRTLRPKGARTTAASTSSS